MIKKASTVALAIAFALTGFMNLGSPIAVKASTRESNPFANLDKVRNESIIKAKAELKDGEPKGRRSIEEKKLQQKKELNTQGNRYIVKFSSSSSLEKIHEVVSEYEYKLLGKSEQRIFLINLKDVESFKKQALGLIESIEEDKEKKIEAVPSDPGYKKQWGLPAINMPKAWDVSKGSESVLVAVIDSGVYRDHPDFNGVDIRNGLDIVSGGPCDYDAVGHGTSVTGIIGAQTNNKLGIAGVNWDVAIVPINVAYYSDKVYVSDTIKAIYLAADAGCKVINLSLGSANYSNQENNAVKYALSKGSIVVAAAGNDGNSAKNYPASYDGVISVGSIKSNLSRSSFSNYNNRVDVVAPGEGVLTTADWRYSDYEEDYEYVSGTSFSSPHVAGVAALAVAADPSITPAKFQKLIETTSKDLGKKGYDSYYGFGLIDAEKILKSLKKVESNELKNAKAKITHLTKSIKTNYLGIKNQATWQMYISQARSLIKKIPSYESSQRNALTIEVDKDEALVNGLARVNHVEKSITPKDKGGFGNALIIKNAEVWNEYLRLAQIDLDKVDKSIFQEQYDELVERLSTVAVIVEEIEVKFQYEYDRVVELYMEAMNLSDLSKAENALVEAEKLQTCERSDELEISIKYLIDEIQGNAQ